jgi:hypothetical protein
VLQIVIEFRRSAVEILTQILVACNRLSALISIQSCGQDREADAICTSIQTIVDSRSGLLQGGLLEPMGGVFGHSAAIGDRPLSQADLVACEEISRLAICIVLSAPEEGVKQVLKCDVFGNKQQPSASSSRSLTSTEQTRPAYSA